MTLQELFDIAASHDTPMSHALLAACRKAAMRLRVRLVPRPRVRDISRGSRPAETVDWERMLETNGDTAMNHC